MSTAVPARVRRALQGLGVLILVVLSGVGPACRRSRPAGRASVDAAAPPATPKVAPRERVPAVAAPVVRGSPEPNLVVTLDLAALRASPAGPLLRSAAPVRQVLERTGLAAVTTRCRLDLWAQVDVLTLVVAFWPGEQALGSVMGQATLWARGRFSAPELLSCLGRAVAGPAGARAPPAGPVVLLVGAGSAQVAAEGQDTLRLSLGAADGAARAAVVRDRASRSDVARALPRSGLGSLIWVALPELVRRSLGQTPALGAIELGAAGVTLDLADAGVHLAVALAVASPDQATAAARTFAAAREQLLRSDAALPPSTAAIVPLLRRLTLAAEGAVITARVTLTLAEADALFLAPFRRYLDAARQGAGRTSAPPGR
jgi:hypothetical protein